MRRFIYSIVEEGIELRCRLRKRTLLGKKETDLKVSEWGDLSSIRFTEVSGLLQFAEDEYPEQCYRLKDEAGYFISFEIISMLSESQARILSLPGSFPYQIRIETNGNIGSSSFNIHWTAYDKHPLNVKKEGCFLIVSQETYRLPKDILSVIEHIDTYSEDIRSDFDLKNAFISELKSLLPDNPDKNIGYEGELREISLQHAAAFSLQITGDKGSMSFNPVLFSKSSKQEAMESGDILEEREQLLSSDDANTFTSLFNETDNAKASYVLDGGRYVFIDRSLRPALNVIKRASSLSTDERIAFARSPQKYIKEALESQLEEIPDDLDREIEAQNIESLFIETREFSDRVTELGIWKEPDFPWLKSKPNQWQPDSYSFYIQEKTVIIPREELKEVSEKLDQAIQEGTSSLEIGGETILPNNQVLDLFNGLLPMQAGTTDQSRGKDDSSGNNEEGTGPKVPMVLLTKENFESIEYNKGFEERPNQLEESIPQCLHPETHLKEHQVTGLNWLVRSYNRGYPGVLIADDMGLGKTLQSLAFLALMVETGITAGKPILVVAPVGLLKNWEEEERKHLSGAGLGRKYARLYGNSCKQFKLDASMGKDTATGVASLDTHELKQHDWLLTSYETLRDYQTSFGQIKFSCVVFDELQKAKNPRGLIAHSTKVLNRDFAIGLTGTPVENSLADLWTIMDILSPGRLDDDLKTFMQIYSPPRAEGTEPDVEMLGSLAKKLLEPASNGPAPVLRRMKEDMKDTDLPKKVLVPSSETTSIMPQIQDSAYIHVAMRKDREEIMMMSAIQAFKSISLHPISPEQFDYEGQPNEASIDEYIASSARLSMAFRVLDKISQQGEKVLIFLENRSLQVPLAAMIKQKYQLKNLPLIINGSVKGDMRQQRVKTFQENPEGFDAIIISPKAGGVGLTLTAANHVIHLDRWWNPAVEDQCTDRAYRIGQTRPVKVYTPIAKSGTVKERSFDCILDRLLESKREIARGLFMVTEIDSSDFSEAFKGDEPMDNQVMDSGAENMGQDGNLVDSPTLEEIDCLEYGEDFENYVIDLLRKVGLNVRNTPRSHDYGADIIVTNEETGASAIIQCKHTSNPDRPLQEKAVAEVVYSTKHYQLNQPKLFVVSNARVPMRSCRQKSEKEGVMLILREDLLEVGQIVQEQLR